MDHCSRRHAAGAHETKTEGEAPLDLTSPICSEPKSSQSKGVGQKMHPARHSKASLEVLTLAVNSDSGACDSRGV